MTKLERKKRNAAKEALQEAKDRCLWFIDAGTLGAHIAMKDRFNRLAHDLELGKLK